MTIHLADEIEARAGTDAKASGVSLRRWLARKSRPRFPLPGSGVAFDKQFDKAVTDWKSRYFESI